MVKSTVSGLLIALQITMNVSMDEKWKCNFMDRFNGMQIKAIGKNWIEVLNWFSTFIYKLKHFVIFLNF